MKEFMKGDRITEMTLQFLWDVYSLQQSSARIYIDPRFRENMRKTLVFMVIENERLGLVFAKTGSIISGTGFDPSILGHSGI